MNAKRIRELCAMHRISIKELGEKVDRTPTGMQHILNKNSTNTGTLERIAYQLGVHPGYFFDDFPIKTDQYEMKLAVPPLVADSYEQIAPQQQSIQSNSLDLMKEISRLKDEKIAMLEERLKLLEELMRKKS